MYLLTNKGQSRVEAGFLALVREKSGQPIERCYQCKKCTAGCPVAAHVDWQPNQVVRLIQFGQRERVLRSTAAWRCLSCETCGERCPNGIHLSEVMDVLRELSLESGRPGDRLLSQFHQSFINTLKLTGRQHEFGMLFAYKMKTLQLFSDLDIGARMFAKGKLKFMPERIRGMAGINRIFARARRREVKP
ncbi:MAG: 4Fe-4S dicluster domain-containing protein [Bacillota bacterium]